MSLDKFLGRQYDAKSYNCLHFARDVWLDQTGVDITDILLQRASSARAFRELEAPETPCLVLLRRKDHSPHIGVFLRGRILHIHTGGVDFFPLELLTTQFTSAKFYNVRD